MEYIYQRTMLMSQILQEHLDLANIIKLVGNSKSKAIQLLPPVIVRPCKMILKKDQDLLLFVSIKTSKTTAQELSMDAVDVMWSITLSLAMDIKAMVTGD